MVVAVILSLLSVQSQVHTIGTMRETMRDGMIEARTALAPLNKKPHLYALGPVEGLRGEITVVDGVIHIGSVMDGAPIATKPKDAKAVFLAYSYVDSWTTHNQNQVAGLEEIADAVAKMGVDRTPFMIVGTTTSGTFHVIDYHDDGKPWSMAKHDSAKKEFDLSKKEVVLFGFFTSREEDAGVIVHHGQRLHVHMVAKDATGHLDSIMLKPGWQLKLPKK